MMLTDLLKEKSIILASQSPRRQELLKGIINDFKIEVRSVDEVYPDELSNEDVAVYLSQLKASAFDSSLNHNEIVITSDTVVCIGDKILGKPKDEKEAIEMIEGLSGKTHEVITAVTLMSLNKKHSFFDKTLVTFYDLTEEEIKYYVQNNRPYDKAGAYGIQEWIGYIGIKEMQGDYYNVMGLPLHKLYRELKKFTLGEGS